MDYVANSTILTFAPCERQQCVNVTIVDDEIVELEESFSYSLERTSDPRIHLEQETGEVVILDAEGV